MNAKEMFEELGYKINVNERNTVEYTKVEDEDLIVFWNEKIEYYNIYDGYVVDVKLYKAIHQQMKELDWI